MIVDNVIKDSYVNQIFKARRVGYAIVKSQDKALKYDIFSVSKSDEKFLEEFKTRINLEELWSPLKQEDYESWHYIIQKAFSFNKNCNEKFGYLLAYQSKPCGILSGAKYKNSCDIHWVATWPLEKNKKMPLAGKILFLKLFKDILSNDNLTNANLTSIKDDCFCAFSKYLSLNFVPCGGNGNAELMKINKKRMLDALYKFKDLIVIKSLKDKDEDEIDLLEITKKK